MAWIILSFCQMKTGGDQERQRRLVQISIIYSVFPEAVPSDMGERLMDSNPGVKEALYQLHGGLSESEVPLHRSRKLQTGCLPTFWLPG